MSTLNDYETKFNQVIGDVAVVDKKANLESYLDGLIADADTKRGDLLTAKDDTFDEWKTKNGTIASLLDDKNQKDDAYTASTPADDQEQLRIDYEKASDDYNRAVSDAAQLWTTYLQAWNPWATQDAIFDDYEYIKSDVLVSQLDYITEYADYPGEVTSAVQNAYVLPA